jgi:RNA processing factor Prp31
MYFDKKRTVDISTATKVPILGKHRYLMPLDDEMRKRIEPLRKPYPKRPKQAMAGDQPEQREGSAHQDAPEKFTREITFLSERKF